MTKNVSYLRVSSESTLDPLPTLPNRINELPAVQRGMWWGPNQKLKKASSFLRVFFNMYVPVRTGVAEICHPILLSQTGFSCSFLSWFVSRMFLLQIFKVSTSLKTFVWIENLEYCYSFYIPSLSSVSARIALKCLSRDHGQIQPDKAAVE